MSKSHNLRNGVKTVEEDEVTAVFVEDNVENGNVPMDDCNALHLMNIEICEQVVERFGVRVRENIGAIVESLKIDMLTELKKRDDRMSELETEVIFLRDAMAVSSVKLSALEATVAKFSANIDTFAHPLQASAAPLPTIDNVIAGDSIVKHVNVGAIEGENQLICLPGAKSHKVHAAVRKLARTANIKNLILHYGTNNIPHQSPMSICREISDSLHRIQHELPNTAIHFSAILPKIDNRGNRYINFINNFICDLCQDIGIGFIQHTSFCQHGFLNKKLYAPTEWREGLPIHPSHEGALLLTTNFKLHLLK
jgi:hypothetical protein